MDKLKRIAKAILTTAALYLLLVTLTNCGGDDPAQSENDRIKAYPQERHMESAERDGR